MEGLLDAKDVIKRWSCYSVGKELSMGKTLVGDGQESKFGEKIPVASCEA